MPKTTKVSEQLKPGPFIRPWRITDRYGCTELVSAGGDHVRIVDGCLVVMPTPERGVMSIPLVEIDKLKVMLWGER